MIWKPLVYKGIDLSKRFLISNTGQIYSLKSKKILKQTLNKSTGYCGVVISTGSRQDKMMIKTHIAVASTFVDGEKEGLVVNHIDGNKQNNFVDNLEWITQSENVRHAMDIGLLNRGKKIMCLNNGMIFNSIKEASIWCGLHKKGNNIIEYLEGNNRTYAGVHPVTREKLKWKLIV